VHERFIQAARRSDDGDAGRISPAKKMSAMVGKAVCSLKVLVEGTMKGV